MKKKLLHEKQCKKCPWKLSTDPHQIPHGYSLRKHKSLKLTIANPGEIQTTCIKAMACHETQESYCIGWLVNQLGQGNNIPLRIKMLNYDLSVVQLDGEQHETFEETLPKKKKGVHSVKS